MGTDDFMAEEDREACLENVLQIADGSYFFRIQASCLCQSRVALQMTSSTRVEAKPRATSAASSARVERASVATRPP